MTSWYTERLHSGLRQGVRIDEPIHLGKTAFQKIEIFRSDVLGGVLVLDDVLQTTEADEFYYHEMLVHVPLVAHGNPRDILIIGGGDGGGLREVLRHPVVSATLVDLDGEVVALCRRHLPTLSNGAFDDPRTRLIVGDGAKFVRKTDQKFDVIIIDSTDPIGPGTVLFEQSFYAQCQRCLTNSGILATQNGTPAYQLDEYRNSLTAFRTLYRYSGFYLSPVPTYIGGDMAYGWASDSRDLALLDFDALTDRYQALDLHTRYYNPAIHAGAFARPNFLLDLDVD